jgi:hypothetical protein
VLAALVAAAVPVAEVALVVPLAAAVRVVRPPWRPCLRARAQWHPRVPDEPNVAWSWELLLPDAAYRAAMYEFDRAHAGTFDRTALFRAVHQPAFNRVMGL